MGQENTMIKVEYINPFLQAATKVFNDMCGIDLKIGKPYMSSPLVTEESIIIMIGITGEVKGQVIITFAHDTTLVIASKMMMMQVNEIDEMVNSAIGELGNMILGNAATIFATQQISIDITPPTIGDGKMTFSNAYAQNICVPLYFEDKHVNFNIAIKTN